MGVSNKKFLMAVDDDAAAADAKLDDKYSRIGPSAEALEEEEDKRDANTIRRETFLNVVKDRSDREEDGGLDGPDLSNGIKFRRDEGDTDPDFELKTSAEAKKKPLIMELDAKTSAEIAEKKKAKEVAEAEAEKEFSFETAERIELKGSFI